MSELNVLLLLHLALQFFFSFLTQSSFFFKCQINRTISGTLLHQEDPSKTDTRQHKRLSLIYINLDIVSFVLVFTVPRTSLQDPLLLLFLDKSAITKSNIES